MDRLLTILRAAHCHSTHHFFALDALKLVSTPRGIQLRDLVLCHYEQYLAGAKDPDTRFRDFHNHVIHVRDGYWGGACEAAELWQKHVFTFLAVGQWAKAAHALGVLSHYFTDPFQPLHTAQSDRESILHRPLEWSICCAYEEIYKQSQASEIQVTFQLGTESDWLSRAIRRGAALANRYYEPSLDQYDLQKGVANPPTGLNEPSREILAEIFAVVLNGWARVIERMAEQSTCELPKNSLTLPTLLAGIQLPLRWITKRIACVEERRAIEQIFSEFKLTGSVRRNLPEEVRQVQDLRKSDPHPQSFPEISSGPVPTTSVADVPHPQIVQAPDPIEPTELLQGVNASGQSSNSPTSRVTTPIDTRRVAWDAPLVDAPSIGPKTAQRFSAIGITTIAEFVQATASDLEKRLRTKWINQDLLVEWQSQANLVCQLPSLRAIDAQLLVGAGAGSTSTIAGYSAEALHQAIITYSETAAGKRYLRSGQLPRIEAVSQWIAAAALQSSEDIPATPAAAEFRYAA